MVLLETLVPTFLFDFYSLHSIALSCTVLVQCTSLRDRPTDIVLVAIGETLKRRFAQYIKFQSCGKTCRKQMPMFTTDR